MEWNRMKCNEIIVLSSSAETNVLHSNKPGLRRFQPSNVKCSIQMFIPHCTVEYVGN